MSLSARLGSFLLISLFVAGCTARPGLDQPHPPDPDQRPGSVPESSSSSSDSTPLAGPELWAEGRYVLKNREGQLLAVDSFRIQQLPDRGWKVESLQVGPGDRQIMAWMEMDREYMPLRGEIVQQAYGSQCQIRFVQDGAGLTIMRKDGSASWTRLNMEVQNPATFWVHIPAPPLYGLEVARQLPEPGQYQRLNTLACGLGAERSVGWQSTRIEDIEPSPTDRVGRNWSTVYLKHTLVPTSRQAPSRVSHLWVDPETGLLLEWIPSWEQGQRRWVLDELTHRPPVSDTASASDTVSVPDTTSSEPPEGAAGQEDGAARDSLGGVLLDSVPPSSRDGSSPDSADTFTLLAGGI